MAALGGARVLAQTFLRSAAQQGIKFGQAFREIQAGGIATYRRTDMLRDYREFAGIPDKADRLKFVPKQYYPSKSLYTMTSGYQRSKFRYQIDFDVYKPLTGETFTMSTNVASERPLSISEMEAAGYEGIKSSVDRSQFDITGYHPFAATVQEGVYFD